MPVDATKCQGSTPYDRSSSATTCTHALESDRIPNAGIVPAFSSTDPIRDDAVSSLDSNFEFADKILFVGRRASGVVESTCLSIWSLKLM